jgi:hypothetical protein
MGDEVKIDDVRALEKGLTQVTTQMSAMVSVVNELKNTSAMMSEAIQIIARKEVTVEHHSESIKILFGKAEKNEEDIKKINSSIYESCSLKTKEIESKADDVKSELRPEIAKVEKNGVGRFVLAMTVISGIFTYFYYDMKDIKSNVKSDVVVIMEKLDDMSRVINSIEVQVKANSLNTKHNKELLELEAEKHKRNR